MPVYGVTGSPTYSVTYNTISEMLESVPNNNRQLIGATAVRNSIFTLWNKIESGSGTTGPSGSIGNTGATGSIGATGPAGSSGATYTATLPLSISGGNVISMTRASATDSGYVTTGTQTIAGDKTFSGSNAYGTPASITLTNGTGLPISTGVSGLGTGIATFLATPSSANLRTALTDETGTGISVFATQPTFTTDITTPKVIGSTSSAGSLTLQSTSHATKGNILFGTGGYDEANNRLGVGTTTFTSADGVSPTSVIESGGHTTYQIRSGAAGFISGIQFINGGTFNWAIYSRGTLDAPNNRLAFRNGGGTELFTMTTAGLFGIGQSTPTSTLHVQGSMSGAYVAKTANYTATISDFTIECTANTFQVTLPTAVGITGRMYNIVNSGAGTITIGTTSSQTFINVTATPTTLTLATVGSYKLQSNGANWMVL